MTKFNYKKYIEEGRLLKEAQETPLKITWDDDTGEVEIERDGYSYESYTGIYDP